MAEKERQINKDTLLKIGYWSSGGWVVFWVLLFLFYSISGMNTLFGMKLNEIGDFFAGILSPLALGWLILGFLLQKAELEQNTEALQLQADELRSQVEATQSAIANSDQIGIENTLRNMLEIHLARVEKLDFHGVDNEIRSGFLAFMNMYRALNSMKGRDEAGTKTKGGWTGSPTGLKACISYPTLYNYYLGKFEPYMESLNAILRQAECISEDRRGNIARFIRAHITIHERRIITNHAMLVDKGEFKLLVEKYGLLEEEVTLFPEPDSHL